MKVTFVYPRFQKFLASLPELDRDVANYFLGDFTTPPSLGIPILASLTPPDIEVELVDDNGGQPVDFDAETDLVAINCFTPQATRAFEIADGFRARGRKVILGGFFPSFMPDECLKHADSVNLGEGEPTWPRILEDARNGKLQPRYVGGCSSDLATLPLPKREIFYQNQFYDWDEDLVQVSRGCAYNCAMCAIPAHMGNHLRFRPIEMVVEEVRSLKNENVYLADDTLFFPQRKMSDYARALFRALTPLQRKYFVSSTMALKTDTGFLDLAAEAGVRNFYCTLNVDPISVKAIQGAARERQALVDLVKAIEDRGIRFFASCAVGRDWDGPNIAEQILDLFSAASIHTAEFFLFTPYPGSVHWDRMRRQGRIFDFDWNHYNGAHVVAKPEQMTPDQLREQFLQLWRGFFDQQKTRHAAALEPATWKEGVQVVGKPLQRQGVRGQAAVTGIGVLSPLGNSAEAITSALREGRHGIGPITRFDTTYFRCHLGGEVKNFRAEQWLSAEELRTYDDAYLHYAIAAARMALQNANFDLKPASIRRDIALVLATCNGGLHSAEQEYAWKHGKSSRAFDERMNLNAQAYGLGKALSAALGFGGETWVVTTACSSTTVALGLAQTLIRQGRAQTVLVGGADRLCVANMSGFDAIKATSSERIAPFSTPYGLNIGEGGCFWIVEDMEQALLRHARLLGRLSGHATTCDAYHPTTPDPRGRGVQRTLELALADSGIALADLGCVNGHGSGTEANDKAESMGVTRFINGHAIPLVSTKSFFGHCMGVTGLLEATAQLLAMNAGFLPPTLNFTEPRPGCALDYVPNQPRTKSYHHFISANYAFGGNNAAVVVSSADAPPARIERAAERVVITGLGCATSAGLGIERTLDNLRQDAVCLTPPSRFPLLNSQSRLVGEVAEFKAADVDRRIDFAGLNPISKFAVAAGRLALAHAGLKPTPNSGEDIGVVMGVCNGPSEMGHMDSVFGGSDFQADISSFSNITANSTTGWIAHALYLKGVNATLAPGPHAGLQSLAYAFDALKERRARAILAGASDEVYAQTFYNYDGMGFLFAGDEEVDYRLRPDSDKRKVLGEGAAMLTLESATHANERGAHILGEMLGYGMSCDAGPFLEQNLESEGLQHAVKLALERAGLTTSDIGLIVWAPQGNRQDLKVVEACRALWGGSTNSGLRIGKTDREASSPARQRPGLRQPSGAFPENVRPAANTKPSSQTGKMPVLPDGSTLPFVTTTFNTGYIESASILVSLCAALAALDAGNELWPQRTGLSDLDERSLTSTPEYILAVASTDVGYNYAAVLRRGWKA